jgi:hypothetical protein
VLVSKAASWFRGADLDNVKKQLSNIKSEGIHPAWVKNLHNSDIDEVLKIVTTIKSMNDYVIRVESPYINFYTNVESDIEKLAKIVPNSVKYVSYPAVGSEANLDDKKIIVKNLDFDYRVTIGKTRQNYSNFVQWCEDKDKVKLTNRAREHLAKDRSWGGYYFYVKDDKMLTMVKMFVGGVIQTVERCVKQ